jgi:hypothetical protein
VECSGNLGDGRIIEVVEAGLGVLVVERPRYLGAAQDVAMTGHVQDVGLQGLAVESADAWEIGGFSVGGWAAELTRIACGPRVRERVVEGKRVRVLVGFGV